MHTSDGLLGNEIFPYNIYKHRPLSAICLFAVFPPYLMPGFPSFLSSYIFPIKLVCFLGGVQALLNFRKHIFGKQILNNKYIKNISGEKSIRKYCCLRSFLAFVLLPAIVKLFHRYYENFRPQAFKFRIFDYYWRKTSKLCLKSLFFYYLTDAKFYFIFFILGTILSILPFLTISTIFSISSFLYIFVLMILFINISSKLKIIIL